MQKKKKHWQFYALQAAQMLWDQQKPWPVCACLKQHVYSVDLFQYIWEKHAPFNNHYSFQSDATRLASYNAQLRKNGLETACESKWEHGNLKAAVLCMGLSWNSLGYWTCSLPVPTVRPTRSYTTHNLLFHPLHSPQNTWCICVIWYAASWTLWNGPF